MKLTLVGILKNVAMTTRVLRLEIQMSGKITKRKLQSFLERL